MTTIRCLAIVAVLVAGSLPLAQVSQDWGKIAAGVNAKNSTRSSPPLGVPASGRGVPPSRGATASVPLYFQIADDAAYRVALPAGWQRTGKATWDYGLYFGTQGESFAVGTEQVFMNATMLYYQLSGYSYIIPREQLVLKSRMLSAPLGPLQVVTQLMPQIAHGAIQNLSVLRTFPMPEDNGFRKMLVLYQYTLVPQRDPAFASQMHPALRSRSQVPMQGAALIITYPYLPGQATWTFGYLVLNAPYDVFQRNERIYPLIFENFHLQEAGMQQKVRSNEEAAKLAASMAETTHQVAHGWELALGALTLPPGGDQPGGSGPIATQTCRPYEIHVYCYKSGSQPDVFCLKEVPAIPPHPYYKCEGGP
jgi:hypothetical protein